jgi:uncharacterized protein
MKYLLVLAVVLAVIWFVRNNRGGSGGNGDSAASGKPKPLAPPQDMVRCPVCAVHLPRSDALPGVDGRLYCCADHRARSGD